MSLAALMLIAAGDVSSGTVSIADLTASDEQVSGSASATYTLSSDGTLAATGYSDINWITPRVGMGLYEVRATVQSGSLTGGTTGTWLALDTSRSWSRIRTSTGSSSCSLLIEIRRASDGTVVDSATIILIATITSA